jgi:hypothetical protein
VQGRAGDGQQDAGVDLALSFDSNIVACDRHPSESWDPLALIDQDQNGSQLSLG